AIPSRVELGNEPDFALGLGKIKPDGLQVTPSHHQDVSGPFHKIFIQLLAALMGNIDTQGPARLHGRPAGRLSVQGTHPRRCHRDVSSVFERRAQDTFRHGTAADIPGADEENVFHNGRDEGSASYGLPLVKSTSRGTNHLSAPRAPR